ncbi:AIR synthase-related protein, partial [Desulfobacterales bacterium HSG17]|nr:AIR synthase-related protein [Desulfobacterales bacterium HSG17]
HIPPVFLFLKKAGNVSEQEMLRTFNNGIGMIAVVPEKSVSDVLQRLSAMNEDARVVGEIIRRKGTGSRIKWKT